MEHFQSMRAKSTPLVLDKCHHSVEGSALPKTTVISGLKSNSPICIFLHNGFYCLSDSSWVSITLCQPSNYFKQSQDFEKDRSINSNPTCNTHTHTHKLWPLTFFVTAALAQEEIMEEGENKGKEKKREIKEKQRTGGDEKRGNETKWKEGLKGGMDERKWEKRRGRQKATKEMSRGGTKATEKKGRDKKGSLDNTAGGPAGRNYLQCCLNHLLIFLYACLADVWLIVTQKSHSHFNLEMCRTKGVFSR